ncbi:MAG: hypothetical protein DRP95_02400 [Candidatus Latescibacterota bacterium]|nr:MAG: hypothetical protein DRP95_02400 [Candidatus Latescibacterota bacterium]
MKKHDVIRLRHMLDAAKDALSFVADKSRDDLDADRMLTLSLVKCIEIIGEAASRLSKECRKMYPQIPWSDIIGMRNRLIHAYYDVNLDVLWQTVMKDIPPLIAHLETIIASAEEGVT